MFSSFISVLIFLVSVMAQPADTILATEKLSLASYNSHGFGAGRPEYIMSLLKDHDFVFLQEHWLQEKEIDKLECSIEGSRVHGVSGMRSNEFFAGRPYGGVAIIWPQNLKHNVAPISTNNSRVCAVRIDIDESAVLLCCVYMPEDGNLDGFVDVLNEIDSICTAENADKIIIGGDFNVDLARTGSRNLRALRIFIENETLRNAYDFNRVDFTFESKVNRSRSTIDHFIMSENVFECISDVKVLHEVDNHSDHSPLVLQLNLEVNYINSIKGGNTK